MMHIVDSLELGFDWPLENCCMPSWISINHECDTTYSVSKSGQSISNM